MIAKVVKFISVADTEEYELVVEALKCYDEYLHSVRNLSEAIKVRKMLGELKQLRKERKI